MNPWEHRISNATCAWQLFLTCFCFIVTDQFTFGQSPASPIIIGVERLYSTQSNLVEAGELLLSELRCVNCHQPGGSYAARLPVHFGPNLEKFSERVRFDYTVEWLRNPSAHKPGTTMPHLLHGKSETERKEMATALAHFLFSNQGSETEKAPFGSVENGRSLFHSIGCVACHEPDAGFKPAHTSEEISRQPIQMKSVPLGNLREKYLFQGLVKFILNPLESRPSAHMPRTPMTETEARDLATFLFGGFAPPVASPRGDAQLAQRGKEYFQQLRCAACHTAKDFSVPAVSIELTKINKDRGCLSASPSGQTPLYTLSQWQREAIQAALANLPKAKPITARDHIRRHIAALNCLACHKRDDIGGPEPGRAFYFQTTGADLEDEGRFPPTLTGVGRKLTPEALTNVLQASGAIRPYMTTRMPDFGAAHAHSLSRHFSEVDLHKNIRPLLRDRDESQGGRSSWGRELLGATGLSCISCHDLNGNKSLGIRAVDLANAPKRLRPEWFRDYLIDPAHFRPGTRMPSFWPEGKPMSPLAGKNTDRQIDSIWVYLNEIDQNRLPEGMEEKGRFELKPEKAPIVFRTFMQDAGLHAIAVGFPQNVNLAFDAEHSRWALAWRGRFLDAEGTWDDRFAPLAAPLGTNVIHFPSGPVLRSEKSHPETITPRFGGYRLNRERVPTFLYRFGSVQVEDTCVPDEDGNAVKRTMRLSKGNGVIWFRAGEAERGLVEAKKHMWRCGKYEVFLLSEVSSAPEIASTAGKQSLWIPIHFDRRGTATLEMKVKW